MGSEAGKRSLLLLCMFGKNEIAVKKSQIKNKKEGKLMEVQRQIIPESADLRRFNMALYKTNQANLIYQHIRARKNI